MKRWSLSLSEPVSIVAVCISASGAVPPCRVCRAVLSVSCGCGGTVSQYSWAIADDAPEGSESDTTLCGRPCVESPARDDEDTDPTYGSWRSVPAPSVRQTNTGPHGVDVIRGRQPCGPVRIANRLTPGGRSRSATKRFATGADA